MLVAALVAVYLFAMLVEVAPDSLAAKRLRVVTSAFMHPYFSQKWNLFAPDVPTTNFRDLLYIRYALPSGAVEESPAVDLSATLDGLARSNRWSPPRVRRALTSLEILAANLDDYRRTLDAAHAARRTPLPATLTRDLDNRTRNLSHQYGLFLSSLASAEAPKGAAVTGVRAIVEAHPIPRLGYGPDRAHVTVGTRTVYDTGWIAYVPGVTQA